MYMLSVSIEKNNENNQNILEINALDPFESSYFGEGPWIPQTPNSQQDTGPKERWQEEDDDGEEE
jgi:hypothetical protein